MSSAPSILILCQIFTQILFAIFLGQTKRYKTLTNNEIRKSFHTSVLTNVDVRKKTNIASVPSIIYPFPSIISPLPSIFSPFPSMI